MIAQQECRDCGSAVEFAAARCESCALEQYVAGILVLAEDPDARPHLRELLNSSNRHTRNVAARAIAVQDRRGSAAFN